MTFTVLLGTVIIPALIVVGIILLMERGKTIDYQCENCGEIFPLSPLNAIVAPHMMSKKYVKCPKCGTVTWVSPVR
jgi:DNA-directed RNA polymerase subunit RPC12/RpoP